jgi:high-affinity Fe2+/Pb2+ permease
MDIFGYGGLLWLVSAIWIVYDIMTNEKKMKQEHKLIWIIAGIIGGIITAIVYYLVVKRKML